MKRFLTLLLLLASLITGRSQLLSGRFLTADHIPLFRADRSLTNLTLGVAFSLDGTTLNAATNLLDLRQWWPSTGGPYNLAFTNIVITNQPAGMIDIFTVPAGKRLYGNRGIFTYTTNTATSQQAVYLKFGTNYYRAGSASGGAAATPLNVTSSYALEAGETLAITNTQQGLSVNFNGTLMDAAAPLKMAKVYGASTNLTLLYTVPTGKAVFSDSTGFNTGGSLISFFNDAGTAAPIDVFFVPPGDTPGDANKLVSGASVSNGSTATVVTPIILRSGYSIYVQFGIEAEPKMAMWRFLELDE